jgi:hypothetical protein
MGTGHQGSRHQHPRMSARWPDKGRRTQLIAIAAALTFAAALGPAAFAQTPTETWPNRFVRLIVPFPPGGGADAIARILSARLSDTWGQQVVIENRGGASGNIAAEAAARSPPMVTPFFSRETFRRSTYIFIRNSATIRLPTSPRSRWWCNIPAP